MSALRVGLLDEVAPGGGVAFVEFATSPEALAGFVSQANYGALNPAANEFIPDTAKPRMPTAPENYPQTFEQDMLNWGGDPEEVSMRFEEWLAY